MSDEHYAESLEAARELTKALLQKKNLDYLSNEHFEEIANAFDSLLQGNWDVSANFTDRPSLRIINEDEYDQHMDEVEDKPSWANMFMMIGLVAAYVFIEP